MDEIKGIARVKCHPGKVEEWKRLSEEAMEIVRTRDSGTLQYEIFFNEDESEAVVFERYRDADAAIEHFSNISHLMEPIMATASVTGEVLGTPNAKMKEQLGKGGPKLFTPWMALQDLSAASRRAAGLPPRPKRLKPGRKAGLKGQRRRSTRRAK
jgi:quinol monooxygenase YgiN